MDERLRKIFADTKAVLAKEDYAVANIKASKISYNYNFFNKVKPFGIICRENMATAVCDAKNVLFLKTLGADVVYPYKLIVFEAKLPFDLTGYLAEISRILAENKIPILAFSAYYTDYLLVKKKHSKKAVSALRSFFSSCKK